jgi:hypothetical protein
VVRPFNNDSTRGKLSPLPLCTFPMPRPGGTAQTRVAAKPRRQVFIRQGFESFAPGQRGMKAPAPRSVSLEARVARSHEQQRPLVRSLCAPAHISAPCPPHGQRCMLHRRSVLQVGGLPGIAGSQCQLGASASWEPVPAGSQCPPTATGAGRGRRLRGREGGGRGGPGPETQSRWHRPRQPRRSTAGGGVWWQRGR